MQLTSAHTNSPDRIMRQTLLNLAKSEHCQLDNSSSSLGLEPNFTTLDIETVELMNDSEYFQRIEILWGDSPEWL